MNLLELNVMDMNELEIKNVLHDIIQKEESKQTLLRYFYALRNVELGEENDFDEHYTIEQGGEVYF
jgi:hypothetical protein